MGKYGSAVSMKDVIEMEVAEVTDILSRSKLTEEERTDIIDSLKEMAYQWCSSNATACAMEQSAKQFMTDVQFHEWTSSVVQDKSGIRQRKMHETYPFE